MLIATQRQQTKIDYRDKYASLLQYLISLVCSLHKYLLGSYSYHKWKFLMQIIQRKFSLYFIPRLQQCDQLSSLTDSCTIVRVAAAVYLRLSEQIVMHNRLLKKVANRSKVLQILLPYARVTPLQPQEFIQEITIFFVKMRHVRENSATTDLQKQTNLFVHHDFRIFIEICLYLIFVMRRNFECNYTCAVKLGVPQNINEAQLKVAPYARFVTLSSCIIEVQCNSSRNIKQTVSNNLSPSDA